MPHASIHGEVLHEFIRAGASTVTSISIVLNSTTDESINVYSTLNSWIKSFGSQQAFLPIHFPQGDSNFSSRLEQVELKAPKGMPRSQKFIYNAYTIPTVLIALSLVGIVVSITLPCRRTHSLEFVRSPTIEYYRTVNGDVKTQMVKAKASLPILAGMKGVFGRGRLKEITDVFSSMGCSSPLRTAERCFSGDFTLTRESCQPHLRIKLLTAEELAREEL